MKNEPTSFSMGLAGGIVGGIFVVLISSLLMPASQTAQLTSQGERVAIAGIDVSDIVEEVNPAVVSIVITEDVPVLERFFETDPFFGFSRPSVRQNGTERREVGGGSGFFVSSDGYVVTNSHVVDREEAEYTVLTDGGESFNAQVIARDPSLDIALLKIDGTDMPFLEFGDSDGLRLGQGVIAIGNALGEFSNSVSTGVVSGLARSITAGNGLGMSELLENVIQTDAAINSGNSGGPLLNFDGDVIGVNVAVARGSENIGFSLPANIVRATVDSIRKNGRVVRPFMGVRYVPVTKSIQDANNLAVDYGALIIGGDVTGGDAVVPNSPAEKAGLKENDVILSVNGQKIDEDHTLAGTIRRHQVGDTVVVHILRNGEERDIEVQLEELQNDQ